MRDDVNELRLAVGALAEVLRMFLAELLKNGFSRSEALQLTQAYMVTIINPNKEDN